MSGRVTAEEYIESVILWLRAGDDVSAAKILADAIRAAEAGAFLRAAEMAENSGRGLHGDVGAEKAASIARMLRAEARRAEGK